MIYKFAKEHEISFDHFDGQGWAKDQTFKPKQDIQLYLTNQKPISSFRLKQRLLSENLMAAVCLDCGGADWLGKPMPLELDHIDGNSDNNQLDNLRLLCPNCHSFTSTYRGKNQKRAKK